MTPAPARDHDAHAGGRARVTSAPARDHDAMVPAGRPGESRA
jgi:hypothetical protein